MARAGSRIGSHPDRQARPGGRVFAFVFVVGLLAASGSWPTPVLAQVENVPVSNQVYEFIDRLGVRGILPLYSNTMIPLPRSRVAELLAEAGRRRGELSGAEAGYLDKFTREFAHEMDRPGEASSSAGLLNTIFTAEASAGDLVSDREKYLYWYSDSSASLYLEFLGTVEHRRADGDSYGRTHATFETHGFRARGTVGERVGYFAQVTNGTLFGDRGFALADPRLRSNVKFNELNSPYFDFAEAYIRADLSWFNLEFGREFLRAGTGYSDRLVFSDNGPATDFLSLDAEYGAVRYRFVHGAILPEVPPANEAFNKYFALHRLEFSFLGSMNAGFSEMVVYQRASPEFAYLNPFLFLKSAEHSLRDRDNTLLAVDLEVFPWPGGKLYGALLIDDVDFSKLGTEWWGNEFGWQGGVYLAGVGGLRDLDFFVEYTRLEPYVYSNRVPGNTYSSGEFGLAHHLQPNSDEWLATLIIRPSPRIRASVGFRRTRHGENYTDAGGALVNVGGDLLAGHRDPDPADAPFLAGRRVESNAIEAGLRYEPVNNLLLFGTYGYRHADIGMGGGTAADHTAGLRAALEF